MNQDLIRLQQSLGYTFRDEALLEQALRHRSVNQTHNNERLEFLGDSFLNMVIAEFVYLNARTHTEGELSRTRASLVKEDALAKVAQRIELGQYLALGSGELKSGGYRRHSILSDALEAVFAAVYLDGGFDHCKATILKLYQEDLEHLPNPQKLKDPKTRLQEYLQGQGEDLPVYELIETIGKSHQQTFIVQCQVAAKQILTQGKGTSRKKAEQQSASDALQLISERFNCDV